MGRAALQSSRVEAGIDGKGSGAFVRPCAIASTRRVLRRAWTADRLAGGLRAPGLQIVTRFDGPRQACRNGRFSHPRLPRWNWLAPRAPWPARAVKPGG